MAHTFLLIIVIYYFWYYLKMKAPSSSLASRLALTQVFLFLTSLSQIWILASYNYVCGVGNGHCMVKILNLKFSFHCCPLRVCSGLQDNSDAPFAHLFRLILHHVKLVEWSELKWKQEKFTCYFNYTQTPVLSWYSIIMDY